MSVADDKEKSCFCMRRSGVVAKFIGVMQNTFESCNGGVTDEFKVEVGYTKDQL